MIKIASSGSCLPERRRALPVTGANFILLAGAGRVLADGRDGTYRADVAVHHGHQRRGLGTETIRRLLGLAHGHKKIFLYASRAPKPSTASSDS